GLPGRLSPEQAARVAHPFLVAMSRSPNGAVIGVARPDQRLADQPDPLLQFLAQVLERLRPEEAVPVTQLAVESLGKSAAPAPVDSALGLALETLAERLEPEQAARLALAALDALRQKKPEPPALASPLRILGTQADRLPERSAPELCEQGAMAVLEVWRST